MLEIALTLVISVLCLFAFIFLFLAREQSRGENAHQADSHVPGLTGVHFPHFDILLGHDDYRKLHARPELKPVRIKFRQDRRRIVLMWLRELQRDVSVLWEFRRFLVKNGLRVTFREELKTGFKTLCILVFLVNMRAMVSILGPFALRPGLRRVQIVVNRLSIQSLGLLSRATDKERMEQMWSQHVLGWNVG
jgi:hypothetical protein